MSQAIIIPGVYRSGTSFLGHALNDAGISMGDWQIGHAEEGDIWAWNQAEGKNNPPDTRRTPFKYHPSDQLLTRLQDYRTRRDREPVYGIKDPQIGQYMTAYVKIWPDAKYVVCLRNPVSSMWSQRDRGHFVEDDREAMVLHFRYMYNIVQLCVIHRLEVHFFNYDGDMAQEERALNKFLGVQLDLASRWKWKCAGREDYDHSGSQARIVKDR